MIASTWKPMSKPSHLFSIEDVFWNSSSWSQKDAFRILALLDTWPYLSLTSKVSDSYFPNEDFKASVQFRLPQLSPRIYHISNKPFVLHDPKWLLKRKEKKPFLSLTQTNPRYRDFHYRFQSQCNCQITEYTKVHANPMQ